MSADDVVTIAYQTIFVIIETAAPPLLISLIVGLLISIFQTVTSIQEQTLTFVPKVLAIFLTIMIAGQWMLGNMTEFLTMLWEDFTVYIR